METLKTQIYDRVEHLRFTGSRSKEYIAKMLKKELDRDVPIELIHEIIKEITAAQKESEKSITKTKDKIVDLNKTKEKEKEKWCDNKENLVKFLDS